MALQEKRQSGPQPKDLVRQHIFNPTRLKDLLVEETRKEALKKVGAAIRGFSPEQTSDLADLLIEGVGIEGVGKDAEEWDAYKRDGAIIILGVIPFEGRVPPDRLLDSFVKALKEQDEYTRPLDAPFSLAKAGRVLAPHFPQTPEATIILRDTWNGVEEKLKHKPGWSDVVAVRFAKKEKAVEEKPEKEPVNPGGKQPRKLPDDITADDLSCLTDHQRKIFELYMVNPARGRMTEIATQLESTQSKISQAVKLSINRIEARRAANQPNDENQKADQAQTSTEPTQIYPQKT